MARKKTKNKGRNKKIKKQTQDVAENIKSVFYKESKNEIFSLNTKEEVIDNENKESIQYTEEGFYKYFDDSSDDEKERDIHQKSYCSYPKTKINNSLKHTIKVLKKYDQYVTLPFINKLLEREKLIKNNNIHKTNIKTELEKIINDQTKNSDPYIISKVLKQYIKTNKQSISVDSFKTDNTNIEKEIKEKVVLNLNISLILQDLGRRLLISSQVRKYYFPLKKNIGEFQGAPQKDEVIKKILNIILIHCIESGENGWKYHNIKDLILGYFVDKMHISDFIEDFAKLKNLIKDSYNSDKNLEISVADTVYQKHITEEINKLSKQGFITPGGKVSFSQKVKQSVKNELDEHPLNKWIKAISKVFEKNIKYTKQAFIQECVNECKQISKEQELDQYIDDLLHKLSEIVDDCILSKLQRPTLPDATIKSYDDIAQEIEQPENKAVLLFSYVRLMHCSQKRYIKNSKYQDGFDGASFSRVWKFNTQNPECIIEIHELTSKSTISSKVLTAYKSSYNELCGKLLRLQKKDDVKDTTIVESIKLILSSIENTKYEPINKFSINLKKFLIKFTYLIFVTEVHRHPAAAIHNILALDLVLKNQKTLDDAIKSLPMSIEHAVSVVRKLQDEFSTKADLPYCYNKSPDRTAKLSDDKSKEYIYKENQLLRQWLEHQDMKRNEEEEGWALEVTQNINVLCLDYYEINLTGEVGKNIS